MGTDRNTSSISDLALGKLSPEESLKVLEEVEKNPQASMELELAADLLNFVALEGKELFERERATAYARRSAVKSIVWKVNDLLGARRFAYPLAALVVLLILVGGLALTSSLTTSEYYSLTEIQRLDFESRVRGPGLQDFDMAYEAFSKGQYDETIRLLERFIRAFPESDLVDYAHYSVGVTYLVSSRKSFITFFPSFEDGSVIRGLEHLELAIQKSSNPRTIEDSHWIRAKGYLMLEKPERALVELLIVQSLNGLRKAQASRLTLEINEIQEEG